MSTDTRKSDSEVLISLWDTEAAIILHVDAQMQREETLKAVRALVVPNVQTGTASTGETARQRFTRSGYELGAMLYGNPTRISLEDANWLVGLARIGLNASVPAAAVDGSESDEARINALCNQILGGLDAFKTDIDFSIAAQDVAQAWLARSSFPDAGAGTQGDDLVGRKAVLGVIVNAYNAGKITNLKAYDLADAVKDLPAAISSYQTEARDDEAR